MDSIMWLTVCLITLSYTPIQSILSSYSHFLASSSQSKMQISIYLWGPALDDHRGYQLKYDTHFRPNTLRTSPNAYTASSPSWSNTTSAPMHVCFKRTFRKSQRNFIQTYCSSSRFTWFLTAFEKLIIITMEGGFAPPTVPTDLDTMAALWRGDN